MAIKASNGRVVLRTNLNSEMASGHRVLVIGAGTAGLCAAKNALENGMEVVIYEQTTLIGGLWNYTDETGVDEHGLPFGYMYRELKTNVPKEIMCFTDFAVNVKDKWFLDSEEVVQFLHSYAKHFNVDEFIQFRHQVIRVLPVKDGLRQWEVLVKDLQNDKITAEFFDFVMVCNGHHFHPMWPTIPGQQLFNGVQKHSFDFRSKEEFRGTWWISDKGQWNLIGLCSYYCRSTGACGGVWAKCIGHCRAVVREFRDCVPVPSHSI